MRVPFPCWRKICKPSARLILVSVPRIYERIHGAVQAKLERRFAAQTQVVRPGGGSRLGALPARAGTRRLEALVPAVAAAAKAGGAEDSWIGSGDVCALPVTGGAALSPEISRMFVGLGLPVVQGYGMTETSPIVTGNQLENNFPDSVGQPIRGVQVKLGEQNALLVKGPNVMMGYWKQPEGDQCHDRCRRLAEHRRHRAHQRDRTYLHHRTPERNHRPVQRRENAAMPIWKPPSCTIR